METITPLRVSHRILNMQVRNKRDKLNLMYARN